MEMVPHKLSSHNNLSQRSPTAIECDRDSQLINSDVNELISRDGGEREYCYSYTASDYTFLLKYLNLPLAAFVVLKYQLDPTVLFSHDTAHFCVCFTAIFIFCIAVMVEKKSRVKDLDFKVLNFVALSSVMLSTVSLVSMLVPTKYSFIPYLLWFLVCLKLTWPLLCAAYHRFAAMIVSGMKGICIETKVEEPPSALSV